LSSPAVYRFLPWSRRGLVAELRDSTGAAAGPLPFRGLIKLDVTLSGGFGEATTSTAIAGPGDVVGVDLGAIVRTTPRRDASNVEPNYLVGIDFDDADFPWLLTPSAATGMGQLRPWLALVVVEDRPGVKISAPAGAPLPQLQIESGASRELPDLDGSWAWAHTQLLVEQGSGAAAAPLHLASDPDQHVSRLLCPRRLRPNTRWHACLVPAFDAGVVRGLGRVPTGTALGPAWTDQDSITLPLYFHWSFGTGPEGDFESLARRLRPFVVELENGVPKVGTVKMHIGAAGGPVDLPEGHPRRIVQMDGALRDLQQEDGKLADVPVELRGTLGTLLDEIADPSGTDPDDGAVGPPLYGSWPANRFAVAGADRGWFAELNLDPRARVAAGLGAEVVRAEQEDLMTACWQQVGAVLKANSLLSRARLSIEASIRFHDRTVALLAPARLVTFAGPLTDRTPFAAATVRATIARTSLPDTVLDPAARRLTAPTSRFVRKLARRSAVDARSVGVGFVSTLAAGTEAVDPTSFVPAGVAPEGREPRAVPGGLLDLSPIGLHVTRPAAQLSPLTQGIAAVRAQPVPPPADRLRLRADLRSTGLVTGRHVTALQQFVAIGDNAGRLRTDGIVEFRAATAAQPSPAAIVLGRETGGNLRFGAVDLTRHGDIVLRTGPTEPNVVLGRFEGGGVARRDALARLPVDTLRPGDRPIVVRPGPVAGDVVVEPRGPGTGGGTFDGPTITLPPPVRDAAVLTRFETAVSQLAEVSAVADARPAATLVAFALPQAAAALKARCAPATAHVARVGTMVRFGAISLTDFVAGSRLDGLVISPRADRIMAYPELQDPTYRMLARYDRDRLLPGVDSIPPDSVTLLETNPRFVAAFLAGVNHELNRELLWRRYPTDQRGTPMRRFWDRIGGGSDIPPLHKWRPLTRTLAEQAGGESNLVLLIRGELLRRYPNTVVLAIAASGRDIPSTRDEDVKRPIFSGYLEPDITFFGFDLEDDDLTVGNGWFFALQEQVTEPRFALDEAVDPTRGGGGPSAWRAVAWPDTAIEPGANFIVENLRAFATAHGLAPLPTNGAATADALFQNPVQVLVHARNLTRPRQT
jgi:hypothetical protein